MDLAAAFFGLANMASAAFDGAPFFPGLIISQGTPGSYDASGEFVPGSAPSETACTVQIDSADWAMRQDKGFVEGSARFIILNGTSPLALDADAEISVTSGPNAGRWLVSALQRDPAGIGWVGRGVKAG